MAKTNNSCDKETAAATAYQCDQMPIFFFHIYQFVTMRMYPIALKKFQRTFNILPNIKSTLKQFAKVF